MNIRVILNSRHKAELLREYSDNYYDKIRVYRSRYLSNRIGLSAYAERIRSIEDFRIDRILFQDLQLRDEENALPEEEPGNISVSLLRSYIRSKNIDLIQFIGEYQGKRLEVGIDKRGLEVWLRIWHLTEEELGALEDTLGLR